MLPIYPLDGGQILRSLLWFVIGKARSLSIAAVIGLIGAAGLIALAVYIQSWWIGLMAIFAGMQAWKGFQNARMISVVQALPRYSHVRCPSCLAHAPIGQYWRCTCGRPIDAFALGGTCLACGARSQIAHCIDCGRGSPVEQWYEASPMQTPATSH